MCGRFSQRFEGRKLVIRYQASNRNFEFIPNQDICPTQLAPVVVMEGNERLLKSMKWGIIPSWAKDPKIGNKCFNARAETVEEKASFKSSFKSRRCLVPVDSFYEWRKEEIYREVRAAEKKHFRVEEERVASGEWIKKKYQFKVAGEMIFSLAGLWARWRAPDGKEIDSFTILTTEPNELMAQYHNRMPVILSQEQEEAWMDPSFANPVLVKGMLRSFSAERMTAETLDRGVCLPL